MIDGADPILCKETEDYDIFILKTIIFEYDLWNMQGWSS